MSQLFTPLRSEYKPVSVLADADLLLELFLNRGGIVEAAERLLQAVHFREIKLYVTDKCLKRVCLELSDTDEQLGKRASEWLHTRLEGRVISISSEIKEKTRRLSLRDFDSAEEVACAVANNLEGIVTHNPDNFPLVDLPIFSVNELIDLGKTNFLRQRLLQSWLLTPDDGLSSYYIQAVTTGHAAFLTTNLPDDRATQVTSVGESWLIGRNSTCAISIKRPSISRCHAVIGHCSDRGFYIMDVGSSEGTFVNSRRIRALEQLFLHDGDLVELSRTRVEFFTSVFGGNSHTHKEK